MIVAKGMVDTGTILDKICRTRLQRVEENRRTRDLATLKAIITDDDSQNQSLSKALTTKNLAIIAEIKKGSPSEGMMAANLDPVERAETYLRGGAAAISIVTEPDYFFGTDRDIAMVKKKVGLPLLRKDFVVDSYQMYETKALKADAVLLIAAVLERSLLDDLIGFGRELQLEILLEIHDREDLDKALSVDAPIIGVNNRNLKTFSIDLARFENLAPHIPDQRIKVAESGIKNRADAQRMKIAGANAILVGTRLVRSDNPAAVIADFMV